MPNFKKHLLIGGAVGFAAYTANYSLRRSANPQIQFDFGKALTWTVVGAAAASLPDWLESATSPNHRGFFHSFTVLFAIMWILLTVPSGILAAMTLLSVALLGYGSHLIADSLTPRCLPWV